MHNLQPVKLFGRR